MILEALASVIQNLYLMVYFDIVLIGLIIGGYCYVERKYEK